MKDKIKSYTFWVSLSGALVILGQSIASMFGVAFDTAIIENIIMAICGVLIVLGIVNKPGEKKVEDANNSVNEIKIISEEETKNVLEQAPEVTAEQVEIIEVAEKYVDAEVDVSESFSEETQVQKTEVSVLEENTEIEIAAQDDANYGSQKVEENSSDIVQIYQDAKLYEESLQNANVYFENN